jgi:hypothetical protein
MAKARKLHPALLIVLTAWDMQFIPPFVVLQEGQIARGQEQDSRLAYLSPLYPPQKVTVRFHGKVASVSWQSILLDRLAKYKVYRRNDDQDGHWEMIGSTTKPSFDDIAHPSKRARYKVVAVDRQGQRSSLSQCKVSVVVDSKGRPVQR